MDSKKRSFQISGLTIVAASHLHQVSNDFLLRFTQTWKQRHYAFYWLLFCQEIPSCLIYTFMDNFKMRANIC